MSENVLESLRAGGSPVAQGGFSIDREKAREKLSKFQLVDPHHYVLQLVQAAYILGASYVDIELDTDEMKMTFDGLELTRAELENLYRASFARSDDPRLRALRHLAIGVTAAWAIDPARIVIDCYDGTSKTRAVLEEDGDDDIHVEDSTAQAKTVIYLVKKVSPKLLVDFFRAINGQLTEELALREYCASADIPILLNGEAISHGHRLRERARGVVRIDTPHEKGRVGVTLEYGLAASHIQILTNGVRVTEIYDTDEPFGYDAIIDSSRLDKGLSQGDILRNDTWSTVRHEVLGAAVYRSLAKFVGELDAVSAATHAEGLRRAAVWLWEQRGEDDGDNLRIARRAALRAFRAAPIWRYAHRADARPGQASTDALVSLDEMGERLGAGTVNISCISLDHTDENAPTAVLVKPAQRAIFEEAFGTRLRDVTGDIEHAGRRSQRIEEFARRGPPSQPDPEYFLGHRIIEQGPFRAFLGVRVSSGRATGPSSIEWTNQTLILHERPTGIDFDQLFIWLQGPLDFRMDPPHFAPSPEYARVALEVIATIPELAAEVLEDLAPRPAVDLLRVVTCNTSAIRLANDLELPSAQTEELMAALEDEARQVRWFDFSMPLQPLDEQEIARRVRALGPLGRVDVIELGLERRVSLETLLDIYREHGRLVRGHEVLPQMSGPLAITGSAAEIEMVERIFGPLAEPEHEEIDDTMLSAQSAAPSSVESSQRRTPPEPEPEPNRGRPQGASRPEEHRPELRVSDSNTGVERSPGEPKPSPPAPAEPAAPFVAGLQRTFDQSPAPVAVTAVEIEDRPGSPAATVERDRCVINAAHPIIDRALALPDSTDAQDWARTAVLTALLSAGNADEREFAFAKLVEDIEAL